MEPCPLCGGGWSVLLREQREYRRCGACALTFVPSSQHLAPYEERTRYLQHRNGPGDQEYRNFLDRLLVPLGARLAAGAEGLDFGSGPGPTASVMLRERGFRAENYDPHFAADARLLERDYDFIVCTEVL